MSPWDLLDEPVAQDLREAVNFEPNLDPSSLKGLKLGRLERRILLCASPPYEKPTTDLTRSETRSAKESWLRAVRKLVRYGLIGKSFIELDKKPWEGRGDNIVAAVCLTVLGEAVVTALRPELEAGTPLRWDTRIGEVRARLELEPWSLLGHLRLQVTKDFLYCSFRAIEDYQSQVRELLALIDRVRERLDNPRPGYGLALLRGLPVWAPEASCSECGRIFADTSDESDGDLTFCSFMCRWAYDKTKDAPKDECIRCGFRAPHGKRIVGLTTGEGLCFDCAAETARSLLEHLTDERELVVFRNYFFRELKT